MKKSAIIIVLEHMHLSGAEGQALVLAKEFVSKYNLNLEVWGFDGPGKVSELCEKYNIKWRVVKVRFSAEWYRLLPDMFRLTAALRGSNPAVILPFTVIPNIVCGSIWRWTGADMCIWNQRDEGRGLTGTVMEQYAIKNTPQFISNSIHAADMLKEKYHISENRIHVVRNGVDVAGRDSDARRELRQKDSFTACMIGKIQRVYKDHETLLRAWRPVVNDAKKKNVHASLLLAGADYGNEGRLKKIMTESGLAGEDVVFSGRVDDTRKLLESVDIGVFSSRLEGCPNGVLECMAAGLPVVATDIPGVREAVGPAGFEYLAPAGDAEKMADLILKFMNDPELRRKVGEANRERIRAEFSVERMCNEYIDLMREHGGLKI